MGARQKLIMIGGIGWLLSTAPSSAQAPAETPADMRQQEARALFQAAQVAYEAGRFEVALERFTEAYTLSNRPQLLYNIGLAAERLARRPEALAAYRAYLQLHPSAPNREEVTGRVRSIELAMEADRNASARTPDPAATADPDSRRHAPPAEHERDFSTEAVARATSESSSPLTASPAPQHRRRRLGIGVGVGTAAAVVLAVVLGVVVGGGSGADSRYQSDFGVTTDLR